MKRFMKRCRNRIVVCLFACSAAPLFAVEISSIKEAWRSREKQNERVEISLIEVRQSLPRGEIVRDVVARLSLDGEKGRYEQRHAATPTGDYEKVEIYNGRESWSYYPEGSRLASVEGFGISSDHGSMVYGQPALLAMLFCIRTSNSQFIKDGPAVPNGRMDLADAGETTVNDTACHMLRWRGDSCEFLIYASKNDFVVNRVEQYINDTMTFRMDIRHEDRPGFGMTPASWESTNYDMKSKKATDWTSGRILSWEKPAAEAQLSIDYPEGTIVSVHRKPTKNSSSASPSPPTTYFMQSRAGKMVRMSDAEVIRHQSAVNGLPK